MTYFVFWLAGFMQGAAIGVLVWEFGVRKRR